MIVICDKHHGGLWLSLQYLFGKRLGYDLRFPYGMDWYEKGYFDYQNKDFIRGTLTCLPVPQQTGQPDLLADPDNIFGYGSGGMGIPITLAEAIERAKDLVLLVSSLHESEQTFARFIADHARQAVLIRQCGNPNERVRFTRHALCSDLETYNRIKNTHHAVLYHQEFNTGVFNFRRISLKGRRKVRSFLNYLADMKYLRRYWERLVKEFDSDPVDFYMHGCKDEKTPTDGWHGAPADIREMADWMADMHMLCQLKNWDGYGHCYGADTEILSEHGWITFDKLSPGTRVATLRHGELVYEVPLARQAYKYKGEMLNFRGRSLDLLVTPEHRMYVGVKRHIKTGAGNERHRTRWQIRKASSAIFLKLRPYSMSTCVEFLKTPKFWRSDSGPSPQEVLDWAELLGWYVSEGCLVRVKGVPRQAVIANTNLKYLWEIMTVAANLGFRPRFCRRHGKPITIRIWDKSLAQMVAPLGKSKDRHIPRWILESPRDVQETFLAAYLKGDGGQSTKTRSSWKAVTISVRLADDLQELCTKLGYRSSIAKRKSPTRTGNAVYVITIDRRKMSRVKKLYYPPKRIEYDGMVYCVTVPSGVVMVRRNGHPVFCGNCIHNSYAIGRPVICRYGDYEAKLGGLLLEDMKTGVKLTGIWEDDRKKIMRILESDGALAQMSWAARQRFEEVVNFDEEEKEIRQWLSQI